MKSIARYLILLFAFSFLSSCATVQPPVRTHPLEGIVNWEELHQAKGVKNKFSKASIGIIFSKNIEREMVYRAELLKKNHVEKTTMEIIAKEDIVKLMEDYRRFLEKKFKTIYLSRNLKECIDAKFHYCGVIDIEHKETNTDQRKLFYARMQLFLLKGMERIASISGESAWHSDEPVNKKSGLSEATEKALQDLGQQLKNISP